MKCLLAQVLDDQAVLMTQEGEFRTVSLNFVRGYLPAAESELPAESLRAWRGKELELPWPPPEAAMVQQEEAAEDATADRPARGLAEWWLHAPFGPAAWARAGFALATAAVLAFTVLPRVLLPRPVAVVAIDINPSLELEVDRQGEVLQSTALNHDAQRVLEAQPVKGLTLDEAVNRVIDQAAAFGYLGPDRDNVVVAAVVSLTGGEGPDPAAVQRDIATRLKDKGLSGFVAVSQTTASLRKDAQLDRLSVNREAVKRELTGRGVLYSEEALRGQSLADFFRGAGMDPSDLYPAGQRVDQSAQAEGPNDGDSGRDDPEDRSADGTADGESGSAAEQRNETVPAAREEGDEQDDASSAPAQLEGAQHAPSEPERAEPDGPAAETEDRDEQTDLGLEEAEPADTPSIDAPDDAREGPEEESAEADAPETPDH